MDNKSLIEKVLSSLVGGEFEGHSVEPTKPPAGPDVWRELAEAPPSPTAPVSPSQNEAQRCFDLNVGANPKAPPIRKEQYPKGATVEVQSPAFGRFKAAVLKDNGVDLWIFHPSLERETCVPNSWIVGEVCDG